MRLLKIIPILLLSISGYAQTVTNGSVTGLPAGNNLVGSNAAGWSVCGFSPDLCSVTFRSYVTGSAVTATASPDGGTWLGLAGLSECAQTSITGLTIGSSYTLCFYGACFGTGTTIFNSTPASPIVCVGTTCQTFTIPQAASTWTNFSMNFTATATTMTLNATLNVSGTYATSAYASLDGFRVGLPGFCGNAAPVGDTICSGDTALVHSTGASTYSWKVMGGTTVLSTNDSLFVTPSVTTKYVVTTDTFNLDTVEVYVFTKVTASFTADSVCFGNRTVFSNTSTGTIRSLLWTFGDGDSSTFRPDTSHLYAAIGNYNVQLIVRNTNYCIDTIVRQIVVSDAPTTNFSFSNVCQNKTVNFFNTSSITSGSISSLLWSWDFGNGGTSTAQNPNYTYNLPGTYTVKLVATTAIGCVDSITKHIVVHPIPVANFTTDSACLGNPTIFTDLSSGTVNSWTWPFSSATTVQNPTHVFSTTGSFPIKLTVKTDSGCVHDTTINVIVNPNPTASFTFSPQDIFTFDTKVCFTNNSTGGLGYLWDFNFPGINGTSTLNAPCTVTFPNHKKANYFVKLYVINQFGCIDSITKELKIQDGFIFYIPNSFTPNKDGQNEEYFAYTEGLVDYELFIFNRWGEKLFHSKDKTERWDGKHKGSIVPSGMYIYRAIITSSEGETKEFVGHINLNR